MNIPEELIFKQMELGPMANFQYIVGDKSTKEVAVVDCGWDVQAMKAVIEEEGYKVVSLFLTHAHYDHVNALGEFMENFDVPIYMSKHEFQMYKPKHKNMNEIENGHVLTVGNINFSTHLVPGHSPGCQLIVYKNVMIAGDAIFIDACGRCDLPGSDPDAMYNSLYNVISKFPDDTIIFPGHNYGPTPYATLAQQKITNPYLNCSSEEEFLTQRMGF